MLSSVSLQEVEHTISMVSDDDDFISDMTGNDCHRIYPSAFILPDRNRPTPNRHDPGVDLIDEMQLNLTRSSKVLDAVEFKTTNPILTDLASRGTMTF